MISLPTAPPPRASLRLGVETDAGLSVALAVDGPPSWVWGFLMGVGVGGVGVAAYLLSQRRSRAKR